MQDQEGSGTKPRRLNPWTTIWSQPEKALDYVLRFRREDFLHRLFMAHGFLLMLALRLPDWLTGRPHIVGLMIQMLLLGPFLGLLTGYIQSSMLSQASAWLGDPVDRKLIRPLIAWTNLPFMLATSIFLLAYGILHNTVPSTAAFGVWLTEVSQGWAVLGIVLPFAAYAVWIRIRAITLLFSVGKPRAALLWAISFALTYLPLVAVVLLYITIFYATIARPGV